jgi:Tol biopolymer transport system component
VLVAELSVAGKNDVAPTLRADGREMLFQSNRSGGLGRADLWVSTRQSLHEPWSTPQNVGTPVNTPSAELHPSLSHDGRTLLFASDRPSGWGGTDIWMSTRTGAVARSQNLEDTRHQDQDAIQQFSAWSEPVSLGPLINSGFGDQNAALSKDGLSLYFASNRPGLGGTDIWVSHRPDLDAPWSEPVDLGSPVNSSANEGAPDVSRDGHWLFFHSNRPGGVGTATDIWVSYRRNVHDDLAWEAPVNLGSGINTAAAENAPNYFENEDGGAPQLFFTRGPTASSDIYVSELGPDGSWGPASPVAELNDPIERDGSPSISRDGLQMYFDSNRHPPRTHIFVAMRENVRAPWSVPVELGAPISTPDGEFLPYFFSRGNTEILVFTRDADHDGIFDLWQSTRSRLSEADHHEREPVRSRGQARKP